MIFLRGIDPASGTTNDAFNTFPDGTPRPHNGSRHATAFTSDESLVRSDNHVRNSDEFSSAISDVEINDEGFGFTRPIDVPLRDVFGDDYLSHSRGFTRLGSKNNPTGMIRTDFTNGNVRAIYKIDQNGKVNLHTLYPNVSPDYVLPSGG